MLRQAEFMQFNTSKYDFSDHPSIRDGFHIFANLSRATIDACSTLRTKRPEQENTLRDCSAAEEVIHEQIGMNIHANAALTKRSFIEELVSANSIEDTEWEGATRGRKRREVSLEEGNPVDRYSPPSPSTSQLHSQHRANNQILSVESDLTTEQSAVCMAADESNSISSLNETSCLLKFHSAVPLTTSNYDDRLHFTEVEDGHSSRPALSSATLCGEYNSRLLLGLCADLDRPYTPLIRPEDYSTAMGDNDTGNSASTSPNHSLHDDKGDGDWLELRLGRRTGIPMGNVPEVCRSAPRTLQLLREEPECEAMKDECILYGQDWKTKTQPLCANEFPGHQKDISSEGDERLSDLCEQSREPLGSHTAFGPSTARRGTLYAFRDDSLWANGALNKETGKIRRKSAGAPCAQHDFRDGEIHLRSPSDDHFSSGKQDVAPSVETMLQDVETSFKPILCSSLNVDVTGFSTSQAVSPSDTLQPSWDVLGTSTSSPCGSTHSILRQQQKQPTAIPTSFKDLIASSIVKQPLDNLNYGNLAPLLPALPKLDGNRSRQLLDLWPFPGITTYAQEQPSLHNGSYGLPLESNMRTKVHTDTVEINVTDSGKSMSDWLSHAFSATGSNRVKQSVSSDDVGGATQLSMDTAQEIQRITRRSIKQKHHSSLKLVMGRARSSERGSAGFWFGLEPAVSPETDGISSDSGRELPTSRKSYIRLRNGDVPVSVVRKFLIAKLGLPEEAQICPRGLAELAFLLSRWG
ncbi:hypothetical protein KP509_09G041000 [Ceratopteris richardii]|uniref:Uncharacterized protein n=1 Tax=Ceratopteris richardii TaxID=49495 RepID=A0A8T2U6S8_CERRI|nr:hypothetical protein KP509_09G041000 [Ceratopteris richardii]KAH7429306.1 hypothetical protein KP509_09G041000 [Ceratopteris richardii]KAH7429307.1 hypothetical protein KP509_09G041000 [Ceratopteris richardii]